ncbi:putative multiple sugar transport system substrate-binding protein [Streptomyces sp. SAI-144]|uniref:substrate-binding domain-containing protein n=1 Tax=unclassified Streptomyces TaxID=2593676 RepID=UPI002473E2B5|nr:MULTISPECIES: sugar-binding protein [unclassified Streptomyces]MDH6434672.1 putative multiple sugar transport system substrate-binding protein [Streptomyces sp. SAI-144]MDH6489947.1 putative multiple sugar transport system substrate-binding protein [Streptomyces sp. SAI-127]
MLTRRATLAALAGTASLALTVSACGKEREGSSQSRSEGGTVGIAMPTQSSERWLADGKSVVEGLKRRGYKTKLVYGDDDPKAQLSQIGTLIEQGVDALIIAAIDAKSLNGVLKRASDARIPVISYDRLILGTGNVDYYVSFDNEMVGRIEANYIIEKLGLEKGKGPFNIELFAGSPDDNNTKYFFKGSMALLQPFLDSKQLVVPSRQTGLGQLTTPRWDGPTAQKRMSGLLTRWYVGRTLDAVLSPYDGISRGVLSALEAQGYGSAGKPLPIVTGQDAELPSVKSIIAGRQSQTVYKDVRVLAGAAAWMVDDILRGRATRINDRFSYNDGVKDVPAYLLQPQSIDKTNYEVLVRDGYYTAEELT